MAERPTIAFRLDRELLALLEGQEGENLTEKATAALRRALVPETPPPATELPEPELQPAAAPPAAARKEAEAEGAFLSTLAALGIAPGADPALLFEAFGRQNVTIGEDGVAMLGDEALTPAALSGVIPKSLQGTRGVGGSGSRAPNEARSPRPTPPPGPLDAFGSFAPDGTFRMKTSERQDLPRIDRDAARMRSRR